MRLPVFLVVSLALPNLVGAAKTFRDYKLVRITPTTNEQVSYLRELWLSGSPYELDFWQPPSHTGRLVDVVISPSNAEAFVGDLRAKGLTYIVAIKDLEQAIRNETMADRSDPTEGVQWDPQAYRFDKYNRMAQIEGYLKRIETDNPDRVTLITIGQTHEKRPLTVVKLSGRHAFGQKPSIWIDSGIHAREWIAPATSLHFIRQLESRYETDPVIQSMLDQLDWYIMPVMNPDGYEFTHTEAAGTMQTVLFPHCLLQRRRPESQLRLVLATGSSSDPCHETFHGPAAFSEPESAAVRDFITGLGDRLKGFISLHSYSQMWLVPYGHRRRAYPQDYQSALRPLAVRAVSALKALYGTQYQVGTGADIMYEAAGGSADWAKGKAKVPYSYLIELRPKNIMFANGFLLPEREIIPTAEETWEAIKVVADELIGTFGQPLIRSVIGGVGTATVATNENRLRPTEAPEESNIFLISTTTPIDSPTPEVSQTTTTITYTTETTTLVEVTEAPTEATTEATTTTEVAETTRGTVVVPVQRIKITTTEQTTRELCVDQSKFCHWWRTFDMCSRDRVRALCSKSCDENCRER